MRFLWTLLKVVLGLAIAIPLLIIGLSAALGLLGALVGVAIFALRMALIGLVAYGAIRLGIALFGGGGRRDSRRPAELSRPVDPYYEVAKRELDREIPDVR